MAESPALRELIRELQRERSPVERMRLLARAWRSVRSLSPEERTRLAQEAGVEGADRVLSRMGAGVSAAQVLSSLRDAPAEDEKSVRTLVERIVEPEPPARLPPKPPPPVPAIPEPVASPEPVPPPRPAAPPPPRTVVVEPPPEPPREAGPSTPDLEAIPSLTLRFRALREFVARGTASPVRLAEAFPDGWARRRATAHLIREGVIEGADSLDAVLATLSRESDRSWCRRLFQRSLA